MLYDAAFCHIFSYPEEPTSVSFFRSDIDSWTVTADFGDAVEMTQHDVITEHVIKYIDLCKANDIPYETWSQY